MATCRIVVNTALRKLGVLAAGREARTADFTDTLAALQGLYTSWIAAGAFGRLCDVVPTGTTYTANGNERILRQDANTLDIVLPSLVGEGWYNDYGCERRGYYGTTITIETIGNETTVTVSPSQPLSYAVPPRDGAPVVISDMVGGNTISWLYDATIHRWQQIENLDEDDQAPRSTADMLGLASCLAMEVADQFNGEVTQATAVAASRYKSALTQRFGMRRESSFQPGAYL